ncbi:Vegetative incompatibility protein HET-E-1 [Colletotrichum gloeosporioides]|uniref:Vegetative incompatibility protein HET-E-1 n=1 Tax=Colletotrichum gloeosporioides TaxID=474922 RepID=A0A8H4CKT7_COLGL|nr:Vegetative incompatibility protein HET-E-1 [Colletotrichum gloeosporioides]KAF3805634.1 Vegetative incompatibility protein HET-E-1 [Colletotrichum gloeosporioides]
MKLLNCKTRQVEDFCGTSMPASYAILSHRWESDEVTYQDLHTPELATRKAGWTKIQSLCRVALKYGHSHVWIDTCCINKQDLTELNEAINSMFKWYAGSAVCYTYLSDIEDGDPMDHSLWFTRGWTLQELIAPPRMVFFDRNWKPIGTRGQFRKRIHRRTRIDEEMLDDTASPRNNSSILFRIPVARRMSWASGRKTSREEDRAYSLLGIFGVNMPMLYGEGSRAFLRLQEEIAKTTNDLSLFSWTTSILNDPLETPGLDTSLGKPTPTGRLGEEPVGPRGIFATSPDEFHLSHDVVSSRDIKYNPEFTVTNKGVKIAIEATLSAGNIWRISLGCRKASSKPRQNMCILLRELGGGVFVRWHANVCIHEPGNDQGLETTFYVMKSVNVDTEATITSQLDSAFRRSFKFLDKKNILKFRKAKPIRNWSPRGAMFVTEGLDTFVGVVSCTFSDMPWKLEIFFESKSSALVMRVVFSVTAYAKM